MILIVCVYVYLFVHVSLYKSVFSFYKYLYVCLCMYMFVCVHAHVYICVCVSVMCSMCVSMCVSVHVYVCVWVLQFHSLTLKYKFISCVQLRIHRLMSKFRLHFFEDCFSSPFLGFSLDLHGKASFHHPLISSVSVFLYFLVYPQHGHPPSNVTVWLVQILHRHAHLSLSWLLAAVPGPLVLVSLWRSLPRTPFLWVSQGYCSNTTLYLNPGSLCGHSRVGTCSLSAPAHCGLLLHEFGECCMQSGHCLRNFCRLREVLRF